MRRARASAAPIFGANSANWASRCCATSSTSSASCSGRKPALATRARTSARQSYISHPRDSIDCRDERLPALALRLERRSAGRREAIESPPPLARFLDPSSDDPPALLHAIQQRIERGDVEGEHALRSRFNELLELVAMPRLGVQQRQEIGRAHV